jgi:hypothetical protein
VDDYNGILEQKAVALIDGDGFEPKRDAACRTRTSSRVRLRAGARRGHRSPKGSIVTILVSSGKKKIDRAVPRREVARHARSPS